MKSSLELPFPLRIKYCTIEITTKRCRWNCHSRGDLFGDAGTLPRTGRFDLENSQPFGGEFNDEILVAFMPGTPKTTS